MSEDDLDHMRVLPGVAPGNERSIVPKSKRRALTVEEYVRGVRGGDRTTIGLAFSLMESTNPEHRGLAGAVLEGLLPYSGNSIRLGVSGVPGAGKSTFVETLGMMLVERGQRVAVLAVDPSSQVTGGSILGDKTRMQNLSRHSSALVRPSPSGDWRGGVARSTRESIIVSEAAGFDVVMVETVGVGQAETQVASMVDFFLVLMLTGGGDELQGMKRGILELAHAVAINKADGENRVRAMAAKGQLEGVLRALRSDSGVTRTSVYTCSSLTGDGIEEVWRGIEDFHASLRKSGELKETRGRQALFWFQQTIEFLLAEAFRRHPAVARGIPELERAVLDGRVSPFSAAESLVNMALPAVPFTVGSPADSRSRKGD